MSRAALIVEVLLNQSMNREKAWDILVSYCIGKRHGSPRYHTTDTVDALSWALNELDRCRSGK